MIEIESHPLLDVAVIEANWHAPLGELESPPELMKRLSLEFEAPVSPSDEIKTAVRKLLRHGGYRPSGRGKPASEYLLKAVPEGKLGSINPAVDICNIVSLHSGLPISVVDLDKVSQPLSIAIAGEGAEYVFNASGQVISLKGLLCLCDADGPCANGVKDSQRTKTGESTLRSLSVIWGTNALPGRSELAANWYRELLQEMGAVVK